MFTKLEACSWCTVMIHVNYPTCSYSIQSQNLSHVRWRIWHTKSFNGWRLVGMCLFESIASWRSQPKQQSHSSPSTKCIRRYFFFGTLKSLNLQFSVFCLQPKALNPKPLKNHLHLVFSFYWSYSRILLAGLWADACWGGRWLLPQIWVDWIQECWYICAKQEEPEPGPIPFSFTLNGCMS